jgi:hypothetical protein
MHFHGQSHKQFTTVKYSRNKTGQLRLKWLHESMGEVAAVSTVVNYGRKFL